MYQDLEEKLGKQTNDTTIQKSSELVGENQSYDEHEENEITPIEVEQKKHSRKERTDTMDATTTKIVTSHFKNYIKSSLLRKVNSLTSLKNILII